VYVLYALCAGFVVGAKYSVMSQACEEEFGSPRETIQVPDEPPRIEDSHRAYKSPEIVPWQNVFPLEFIQHSIDCCTDDIAAYTERIRVYRSWEAMVKHALEKYTAALEQMEKKRSDLITLRDTYESDA
jgi:hypothetical protein